MPIAIFESAEKCAEILGVNTDTFYAYLSRQRQGKYSRGVEIFRDDPLLADHEVPNSRASYALHKVDFKIVGYKIAGYKQVDIARLIGQDPSNITRRLKRVKRIYGYDPWKQWTQEQFEEEEEKYFAKTMGK